MPQNLKRFEQRGPQPAVLPYCVFDQQFGYQFPSQVTFSSLRIYAGQWQSGTPAVAAAILPGTLSASSGAGTLAAPATEVDMTNIKMVQAVESLLQSPGSYSVSVGTVENPAAPLTGQLRNTDLMTFQIPGFAGSGANSQVRLHTLRLASGDVQAGTLIMDVNYRFGAGTQITDLDVDGAIVAPAITADPGRGNVDVVSSVFQGAGLTSLNGIVSGPEAHQINIQTSASTTTTSAPLATANTAAPVILAVIPIVEDKTLATFAPGELVEIYGTNLAKVTTALDGWPGGSLPDHLNGVTVSVGGHTARLLYVSPGQLDAAFPFETPTGSPPITANNGNAPSAAVSLNVAAIAPALYSTVFKNADFSIVGATNPAKAGDIVVVYGTGFGQTTPVLSTGQTVPAGPPFFNTATVTATVGGQTAKVDYSIAAPPYVAGLYQVALTVPSGLAPGTAPVVVSAGGLASNTVNVALQ